MQKFLKTKQSVLQRTDSVRKALATSNKKETIEDNDVCHKKNY